MQIKRLTTYTLSAIYEIFVSLKGRTKKYQDLKHKYLGRIRRTTWETLRKGLKLIE